MLIKGNVTSTPAANTGDTSASFTADYSDYSELIIINYRYNTTQVGYKEASLITSYSGCDSLEKWYEITSGYSCTSVYYVINPTDVFTITTSDLHWCTIYGR